VATNPAPEVSLLDPPGDHLRIHFDPKGPLLCGAALHPHRPLLAGCTSTPTTFLFPLFPHSHDLRVCSSTGSGKTAAFVWPALERILAARLDPAKKRAKGQTYGPRVLVLAPTRELAQQVARACSVYGYGVHGLRVAHVVGGVPYQAQLKALRGRWTC
jgi:hypothetical protein